GGWLTDNFGYRAPFVVAGLLATFVAAIGLFALVAEESARASSRVRPLALLGDRQIRATCALIVGLAASLGVLEPMLPLDATARLHASPTQIGLLFVVTTIAYGASSPFLGTAADKFGAARLLRGGWLLGAVLLPLLVLPG